MTKRVGTLIAGMLLAVGVAAAEEYDAAITDASRAFAKRKSAGTFVYGKLKLDSKGKVVSTTYRDGLVTKDTVVVEGKFDEKTKQWEPGDPIKGGVSAAIFKAPGKEVQVLVTVADDKKTITRILVKKGGEPLAKADSEFDAILKAVGPQTNGRGGIGYVRLELDDKGGVVKTFGLKTGTVTEETAVVMGKYNEVEKKWEAGDAIPKGLYGDVFKQVATKTVYVRIKMRDDGRGIAQILFRQAGDAAKK